MKSNQVYENQIKIIAHSEETENSGFVSCEFQFLKHGEKQGELKFSSQIISEMKTAIIHHFWSNDEESAAELLKEATMYAWETGFELMFGTVAPDLLSANGFQKVTDAAQQIYCSELTWNALTRFNLNEILPFNVCKN